MKKNKILIIFSHPLYEKSKINQIINEYIPNNEHITFHDLYEEYPYFEIDIHYEQKLLLEHDIIIWQHPLYWFSCPALLKQWIDMVLYFNKKDSISIDQLKGKSVLQIMTLGKKQVNEDMESRTNENNELLKYLTPFKKTVEFCNMNYLPPFFIQASSDTPLESMHKKGEKYAYILEAIVSNFVSCTDLGRFNTMNEWLNSKTKTFG